MLIKRVSPLTGMETTLNIPVTEEQIDRWKKGELIQIAMPHLTADQREFIKTGITSAEWANVFYAASRGRPQSPPRVDVDGDVEDNGYDEENDDGEVSF